MYKTIHSHIRIYTYNKLPPPVARSPSSQPVGVLSHVFC
nr:MAG TPA: hypothetical protein [Caudoviricetes sp.]